MPCLHTFRGFGRSDRSPPVSLICLYYLTASGTGQVTFQYRRNLACLGSVLLAATRLREYVTLPGRVCCRFYPLSRISLDLMTCGDREKRMDLLQVNLHRRTVAWGI